MLTQYIIIAAVRTAALQLLFAYLLSKLVDDLARRRAIAALTALLAGAGLDGVTPDGWEIEYVLGHPFFFYLFLNGPIVLVVFALLLIFQRKERVPDDPFS